MLQSDRKTSINIDSLSDSKSWLHTTNSLNDGIAELELVDNVDVDGDNKNEIKTNHLELFEWII